MAYEAFEPPLNPSFNAKKKSNARTLAAPFGDGYSQRTSEGIPVYNEYEATWNLLNEQQLKEIEAFFIKKQGVDPFEYTPPKHRQSSNWTVNEWEKDYRYGNHYRLKATFERVFDQ